MLFSKAPIIRGAGGLAALLLAGTAMPASAATFIVDFNELNDSGVQGSATLVHDEDAQTLSVAINATGLAPNQPHLGHIHGRFNPGGQPIDSVTPPPSADTDGDGFVELGEGAVFYGPIILPLSGLGDAPGGVIDYFMTFDLTNPDVFGLDSDENPFTAADLFPLTLREIVLHGDFVDPNAGAGTGGIIDGMQDSYSVLLPVASGEITAAVPEPGTWAMMLLGFGFIGGAMRSAKRRQKVAVSYA